MLALSSPSEEDVKPRRDEIKEKDAKHDQNQINARQQKLHHFPLNLWQEIVLQEDEMVKARSVQRLFGRNGQAEGP
jgi:hypothetical protein